MSEENPASSADPFRTQRKPRRRKPKILVLLASYRWKFARAAQSNLPAGPTRSMPAMSRDSEESEMETLREFQSLKPGNGSEDLSHERRYWSVSITCDVLLLFNSNDRLKIYGLSAEDGDITVGTSD